MFHFQNAVIFVCLALNVFINEGKVLKTRILTEESCESSRLPLKNVRMKCELKNLHLIAEFQVGHSIIAFLIDTGSAVNWVINKGTRYSLISKKNRITVRSYGTDSSYFFDNKPTKLSPSGNKIGDIRNISYSSGATIVYYDIYENPIVLKSDNWTINIKMALARCIKRESVTNKYKFAGIIGLRIPLESEDKEPGSRVPKTFLDLAESFLFQLYYQHKGTSKSMVSFDVNFKDGQIPSSSYIGFGESTIPSSLNASKMVSVISDSSDWKIQLSSVKFLLPSVTVPYNKVINAVVDTGSSRIRFPEEFPEDIRNFTFFRNNDFPCHQWRQYLPVIQLIFNNTEVVISNEFLYRKGNAQSCTSLIASGNRHSILLGLPFFSAVYTELHFEPNPGLGLTQSLRARVDMLSKI